MQPITITPDFDHPFELHTPEYEEVFDSDENVLKVVLVAGANFKTRWTRAVREERTLEDSMRIAAKTTELLLSYGMDLEKDSNEQREWFIANPIKTHKQEINRLPAGTPAIEIFKRAHAAVRNEAIVNTPQTFGLAEGVYKTLVDERGVAVHKPLLDIDITVGGKQLRGYINSEKNKLSSGFGVKNKTGVNTLAPPDIYTSAVGAKLSALLNEYDKQIVKDAIQLRTYITNKLLEISNCGNAKDELRALELLGKISDIGLFVEKSEVNITHTSAAALEHSIKDKINRMLGKANVEIEDADFRPLPRHIKEPVQSEAR
jgi:hypothetical protein